MKWTLNTSKITRYLLLIIYFITFTSNIVLSSTERDYYRATSDLNVRSGAGMNFPVLFILHKDDEVGFISKKGKWCKIQYLGKSGYAYSEYLEYSKSVPDSLPDETSHGPEQGYSSQEKSSAMFFIVLIVCAFLYLFVIVYRTIRNRKLLQTVTELGRGPRSERNMVLKLLKNGFSPEVIFHDLYVEKEKDTFSQIDVVLISKVGIIVIEVKDYSGWIYGSGNDRKWTEVLAYGKKKYSFYNPIKQNKSHIKSLKKSIPSLQNIPLYSIIAFYGKCRLKDISFIPEKTFIVKSKKVIKVIKTILKNNEPIKYAFKEEISTKFKEAVANGRNKEIRTQHIENIRNMLGKDRIY